MISFKGRHFPKEILLTCVRWYLAYQLSYRDIEEMMAERGTQVDHSTIQRWVDQYAPQLEAEFTKKWKRPTGSRWRMDETYIKVKGEWKYLYRAVDKSVGANGIADIYTYFLIREFVSDLQQRGHGSVFNTITRETFRSIIIPFSNPDLTCRFDKTVETTLERIRQNFLQNSSLSKLRDTLLPKLISGELRIPEVKKQVKEAVA